MYRKTLNKVLLILQIISVLVFALPVLAQSDDVKFSAGYTFGEQLDFSIDIPEELKMNELWVFLRVEGEQQTRVIEIQIQEGGNFSVQYDLSAHPIRAFAQVEYWIEGMLTDGSPYKSASQSLFYEDNRFEWQSRQMDKFRIYWHEGDTLFGQTLLDVANLGLENVESLLQTRLESPVDIYAYANAQEMRAMLQTRGPSWVGAHADPDLGVMVISLPSGPELRLEMERQIPHELMHILLYQELGTSYDSLPVWLSEGLASMAELYPNPDYLVLLDKAHSKDTLLAISSLCQTFPREASGAFLAYAQATSFTRYLYQQYGSPDLAQLVENYANGMDCERGVQATYEVTLTQLERQWRSEAFRENTLITALWRLLPWFILMGAVLTVPLVLVITSRKQKPTSQKTS